MDAGQIGRIADLHGFAARRVRDTDVPYASSVQGWQATLRQAYRKLEASRPCDWIPASLLE